MLVVKVELHSARTGKVTEIARAIIANVGGTNDLGDYTVRVGRKAKQFNNKTVWHKPLRTGEVKAYPRLRYNVWRLVIRALLSAFEEEKPK